MKIRKAKKADLGSLALIFTEIYNGLDIGEKWTKKRAFELLGYYYFKHPELAFTAEENGKPVGAFFAGVKPWWDGYHLFDGEMFVLPEYHEQGIGRALLKIVLQTAKKQYAAVHWDSFTFTGRRSPLPWYKKVGIAPPKGFSMMSGEINQVLRLLELQEQKFKKAKRSNTK